jgi:hypothetical protein
MNENEPFGMSPGERALGQIKYAAAGGAIGIVLLILVLLLPSFS